MWKKSAPKRSTAAAYGDSVSSGCCSSAALDTPGERIAVPGDMRDGAVAK
jgi:hypothetical protein